MAGIAPSQERLCWRAWPCDACRRGVTPIGYLVRRREANPAIYTASIEAVIQQEVAFLQEWISGCDHGAEVCETFAKVSEGSEHYVYLEPGDARVFKATKVGLYGENYYLVNGVINQRNCSPLDYLSRLRIWKHVFGSAPEALGITSAGQIVSFHDFITGVPPTQAEINEFLLASRFTPVKADFLWKREYPEENYQVGLGDARDENFVKTDLGVVPIDVRLWITMLR